MLSAKRYMLKKMSRLPDLFKRLKRERRAAFIAYLTAGDPSLALTERFALELQRCGADIIELGVPFSDPIADGPTIQRASARALSKGVTLRQIISCVANLRRRPGTPIILMSYYNPILHYGLQKLCSDSSESGVDGLIVPDLPPEEAQELIRYARAYKIDTIFMLSPTSTQERIRLVAAASRGFIYYVSLTGTTGSRKDLPRDLVPNLLRIKRLTKRPICVGFGLSTEGQVRKVSRHCDGFIVGSAIVEVIEQNLGKRDIARRLGRFAKGLSDAARSDIGGR